MSKAPICEDCDVQMVERTNRLTGIKFYGCPNFPECKNTEEHEDADPTDAYGNSSYFDTLS